MGPPEMGVSMGKVSIRLVNCWLDVEPAPAEELEAEFVANLLSGDEVAVEVELALRPLSARRATECWPRPLATTVCDWCV